MFGLAAGALAPFASFSQQQKPTLPVIGLLGSMSADSSVKQLIGLRAGLTEHGFVEGQNIAIQALWSDGQYDRLPALASEFVKRNVNVILAAGLPAAQAAKAATARIPIVFVMGADPVKLGIVSSMSRPDGNLTGISQLFGALGGKRLELLGEIVPKAKLIAVLSNPDNSNAESHVKEIEAAAKLVKMKVQVFAARTGIEIDAAFKKMLQAHASALLVADDPRFTLERRRIVGQASSHRIPAIHYSRDFAEAGGLLSYGSSGGDNYRLAGAYVGRILKGAMPADLPVLQPTKFELVVNMKTAKALRVAIPPSVRLRADELIE